MKHKVKHLGTDVVNLCTTCKHIDKKGYCKAIEYNLKENDVAIIQCRYYGK